MSSMKLCHVILLAHYATLYASTVTAYFNTKTIECGTYGFVCEGTSKLRLCEEDNLLGPSFLCPSGTFCNEDSSDVCESLINYVDPDVRTVRCRRNERIADPSVPGCKGYILCIPNKNRFQGIKFKCTGNTIFNGFTRTCSAPDRYKCPLMNSTKTASQFFENDQRKDHRYDTSPAHSKQKTRPIDCKNYKLTVTQEKGPNRATYFCPSRPLSSESAVKCTVFSNHFCIILERDDEDQFISYSGAAYRRPRKEEILGI